MVKHSCVRSKAKKRFKDKMDFIQSSRKVILEEGFSLDEWNKHLNVYK